MGSKGGKIRELFFVVPKEIDFSFYGDTHAK